VVAIAEVKSILKSAGDQYLRPNTEHHEHVMEEYQEAVVQGKEYVTDHHGHDDHHSESHH